MLRTNTKIVINRIHQHIFDCIIDSVDDNNYFSQKFPKDNIKIYSCDLKGCIEYFNDTYSHYVNSSDYSKKLYNDNRFNFFIYYMQGLPYNFEFYYHKQRNFLKELLEETEEECNKFTDSQVEREYYYLIYRELMKLVDKMKEGKL